MSTIFQENFDSLTLGPLNGQNGWSGSATVNVVSTQSQSSPNSIQRVSGAGLVIDKAVTATTGTYSLSFYLYITDAVAASNNVFECQMRNGGGPLFQFRTSTGTTDLVVGATVIGNYIPNTWNLVRIESNVTLNTLKGNVNGGTVATIGTATGTPTLFRTAWDTNNSAFLDSITILDTTTFASAEENFDSYSDGAALNALNGGSGWNGAWSTGSAFTITNAQFDTSPNSLSTTTITGSEANRDFATVGTGIQSDISFKFKVRGSGLPGGLRVKTRDNSLFQNFGITFLHTGLLQFEHPGGNINPAISWVPNTWYEVIMKYNRTTGQYSWQVDNSVITTATGATGRNYFKFDVLNQGVNTAYLDTVEVYSSLIANNPVISGSSSNSLMFSGGI